MTVAEDLLADLALLGGVIHRTVPLEDISVKQGRTVEAYLAVFDTEAEIRDGQGHYKESIDRSAFNKAISDARPQGSRASWKTSVYYNHAMTPYGTPSERWSTPVAVTRNLVVEARGVVATDHYMETPEGDHALELVRAGAVKGYSFTGRLIRSDPNRPPAGGFRATRNGGLPSVRRLELGLSEYGPTPEPAYETAGVLGMRADFLRLLAANGYTPEQAMRLLPLLSATPDGEPADSDTSDNSEAVAEEPLIQHSVRQSPFARRLQVALTARGMCSDDEAAGNPRAADGHPRRTA
jgi:phage head maturation protease